MDTPSSAEARYPVQFSVDYPDKPRDRGTVALRLIVAIPILVILGLVAGGQYEWGHGQWKFALGAGGFLAAAPGLMIVFRQKYPRWWFDWNLGLAKFSSRVCAYLLLLRDEYPSTDEEQAVHLEVPYPNVQTDLNPLYPLFKWLLAIPHYIVLWFLWVLAILATIVVWFMVLFTGSHRRDMFDYVVGVLRWTNRVGAYAYLMATDKYPPFSLEP